MTVPSLFDAAPSPVYDRTRMDEARAQADHRIDTVEAHADPDWMLGALDLIKAFPKGYLFLAQEVTQTMAENGHTTHDKRAAGAVIRKAKFDGLIVSEGFGVDRFASPKTMWRRA